MSGQGQLECSAAEPRTLGSFDGILATLTLALTPLMTLFAAGALFHAIAFTRQRKAKGDVSVCSKASAYLLSSFAFVVAINNIHSARSTSGA